MRTPIPCTRSRRPGRLAPLDGALALLAALALPGCPGESATDDGGPPDAAAPGPDGGADAGADAGVATWAWEAAPALPSPRQSSACAASDTAAYVVGGLVLGDGPSRATDEVLRLDDGADAWEAVAPLPAVGCCAAAAVVGDRLYLAGGYEADLATPSPALLIYDPAADRWESGPPMPTARALAGAVAWDGRLAVVGGRAAGMTLTGVIELYDPALGTWTAAPESVPTPREAAAVIRAGEALVVAGGYPADLPYGTDLVEVLTTGWAVGPLLPLPAGQVACGAVTEGVVVAGGWGPEAHSARAAIWDLQAEAWTLLPDLPTARAGACGAVVGGRLLVVGGGQYAGGGEWTSLAVVDRLVTR